MSHKRFSPVALITVLLALEVSGCGGSASIVQSPARLVPPTRLAMQSGTVIDGAATQIASTVSTLGPAIVLGTDANGLNALWIGSQEKFFYTNLASATLTTANYDFAIGTYQSGSFLWAYRLGQSVIPVPNETLAAVSKSSDVFLDLGLEADQTTPYANLLKVRGGKLERTPYILPSLDYSTYFVNGVCINSSGTAIIDAFTFIVSAKTRGHRGFASRAALLKATHPPLKGSPAERLAQLKARVHPTTTSSSPTGYYLLSPSHDPIALAMPNDGLAVTVYAINDQGVSVGVAFVGNPNDPAVLPYYWDAQGNPYPLQLSGDLSGGYAYDINNAGTVVGEVGNAITSYGAMWNAVDGTPTNINNLLPVGFTYNVQALLSIGNDFNMSAVGNPLANTSLTQYFGLRPY